MLQTFLSWRAAGGHSKSNQWALGLSSTSSQMFFVLETVSFKLLENLYEITVMKEIYVALQWSLSWMALRSGHVPNNTPRIQGEPSQKALLKHSTRILIFPQTKTKAFHLKPRFWFSEDSWQRDSTLSNSCSRFPFYFKI